MKKDLGQVAIYDARELGVPRMLVLGLQHLFAMFGATVLVPILVNAAVCRCGYAAVPFVHQVQGAGVSWFQFCLSGRL